jgi:hypothetical protein
MWKKSHEAYAVFGSVFDRSRLKVFQVTLQTLIGAGLLWWIVSWIRIDGERFAHAFRDASFLLLSIAVLCFALSTILKSFQYSMVLPRSISGAYIAGLILSQNALLTFLPWRVGELSLPVLLRQDHNIAFVNSASAILIVRFVDLLIVVLVAIVGSQHLGFQFNLSNAAYGLIAATVLVGAIYAAWCRFLGGSSLSVLVAAIKPRHNPVQLGSVLLLAICIFVLSTLQSTFALRAFGLPVLLLEVALLNALTLLAALLPIHPPGGWGTIDSIQIALLHYLNYQPEHSAPVILAAHCFYTLLFSLGGMFGWILRVRSLPR